MCMQYKKHVICEKPFAPTARVQIMEEEPPLFPEHGEVEFPFEKKLREEQVKIVEEEAPLKPRSFLDKILGRSLSKNDTNEKVVQRVITPKFDENIDINIFRSVEDVNLNTIGGHLKDNCLVNVTAEIVLGEFDDFIFTREYDESTGYKELVIEERKDD